MNDSTVSRTTLADSAPFDGFWTGGFEGVGYVDGLGQSLHANGHRQRAGKGYGALRQLGIRSVRERIGWRLSALGGPQGDAAIAAQAQLAARHGMHVLWTLMHYGWLAGIDPFVRPKPFIDAFARHCRRVASLLRGVVGPLAGCQPVTEISVLAWAASSIGPIHPHLARSLKEGDRFKRLLVRAALQGTHAIWREPPSAGIVHTYPLVSAVQPRGARPAATLVAEAAHDRQFHAWDMLCGKRSPERGGASGCLDVVGGNYYQDNHWEAHSAAPLHWHPDDPRQRPFEDLIADLDRRYGRMSRMTGTEHVGEGRRLARLDRCRCGRAAGARGVDRRARPRPGHRRAGLSGRCALASQSFVRFARRSQRRSAPSPLRATCGTPAILARSSS